VVGSIVFPKDGRFIATGPFDADMPHHYIIIQDYRWFNAHEDEIYAWMKECLPNGIEHHQGMVIVIEDDADASNFLLRWQ
jgi:hypothetical protein